MLISKNFLTREASYKPSYFVEPVGAGRHRLAGRGEAELKTGHGSKIGRVSQICESGEATPQEYRDELNICRVARSAIAANIGPSSGSFSVKEAPGAAARPDC